MLLEEVKIGERPQKATLDQIVCIGCIAGKTPCIPPQRGDVAGQIGVAQLIDGDLINGPIIGSSAVKLFRHVFLHT